MLSTQGRFGRGTVAKALVKLEALENKPLFKALSGFQDSREANSYAAALLCLDTRIFFSVIECYEKQFRRYSWVSCLKGQAQCRMGEPEEAQLQFQKAIKLRVNGESLLALAHFHLEQYDHFWGPKAFKAVSYMLQQKATAPDISFASE